MADTDPSVLTNPKELSMFNTKNERRWRRTGVAALLACLAAGSTLPNGSASADSDDLFQVTFRVTSVQVHDDADAGVYGCGDVGEFTVNVSGVGTMTVDTGRKWQHGLFESWQDYCSDSTYSIPKIKNGTNRISVMMHPNTGFTLNGSVREDDHVDHTGAVGSVVIKPVENAFVDRVLEVEGINAHGHLRMSIAVRVG